MSRYSIYGVSLSFLNRRAFLALLSHIVIFQKPSTVSYSSCGQKLVLLVQRMLLLDQIAAEWFGGRFFEAHGGSSLLDGCQQAKVAPSTVGGKWVHFSWAGRDCPEG